MTTSFFFVFFFITKLFNIFQQLYCQILKGCDMKLATTIYLMVSLFLDKLYKTFNRNFDKNDEA